MTETTTAPTDSSDRRQRSEYEPEFARIVAFSDGVFAVAITLLVLYIEVPTVPEDRVDELPQRLFELWRKLLAYAISFAVIGRMWTVHHRFFGSLAHFDRRLMTLNLLFLAFVVLIPFASELLGLYGEQPSAVVAFATILACAGVANWLMIRHAVTAELTRAEEHATTMRFGHARALAIPLVFLASIPVGLFSPTLAQLLWLSIFFIHGRLRPARAEGEAAGRGSR